MVSRGCFRAEGQLIGSKLKRGFHCTSHWGNEDADSEDEVNESPNLDHQDDPSIPRPPPEPPDIKKCFEPEAGILIIKEFKGVSKSHDFMTGILPTLPTLVSDLIFISSFVSFENEDTIFDPGIST
ncbi:hypothetical protein Tco_0127561 [Tanacetum coccineum]